VAASGPIAVVPYDPEWPRRFEAERALLERVLAPWLDEGIHHVGSTAIPGIAAKPVIDIVLAATGLDVYFAATVSSEEVPRGKPAPDVYLEVSRRLGIDPTHGAAIEDSTNGLLSALAAGLRVVAVPRAGFPPDPGVLARADAAIPDLEALTVEVVDPFRVRFRLKEAWPDFMTFYATPASGAATSRSAGSRIARTLGALATLAATPVRNQPIVATATDSESLKTLAVASTPSVG